MLNWAQAHRNKVILPEHLKDKVAAIRKNGKTIATINGSFDLLHAGHLHILFEAAQVADMLIVALNSDHSIKQYKSPNRPIHPLEHRLQMMAALEFVDFVTWFDETDPCQTLDLIKPDVHVNGADYGENCLEADTVHTHGGKIHLVSLLPDLSTSSILEKV